MQPLHKGRVLRLRVAHNNVIGGEQKTVGDFPLGGKGLAGAGSAENQPIRLFVKRNFFRDGKNQAEKPCGRLKAVFAGRQYKTLTPPRAGAWSVSESPYSCGFGGCAASLNVHARR